MPSFFLGVAATVVVLFSLNLLSGVPSFFVFVLIAVLVVVAVVDIVVLEVLSETPDGFIDVCVTSFFATGLDCVAVVVTVFDLVVCENPAVPIHKTARVARSKRFIIKNFC